MMTKKSVTQNSSLGQKTTWIVKDIAQNTDEDDLADILEDPFNLFTVLTEKIPQSLRNIKRSKKPLKQPRPNGNNTRKTRSIPRSKPQEETKKQLVLLLADDQRFGLDDLHKYWQEFVNPLVDWVHETRRMTQRELARELVFKVSQNGRIAELQKAIGIPKIRESVSPKKRF